MEEKILKIISRLRRLPEEDRWRVSIGFALFCGFIFFVLWLFLLPLQMPSLGREEQEGDAPASAGILKTIWGEGAGQLQKQLRETASRLEREASQKNEEQAEREPTNEAGVSPSALP